MNKDWISVEDNLPYDDGFDNHVFICFADDKSIALSDGGTVNKDYNTSKQISHWMYLHSAVKYLTTKGD